MKSSLYTDHSRTGEGGSAADRGAAKETSLPDDPSASGNLDKIRDILFGEQARSHDRRFAQLEQHLVREAADLRSDLKRRFDELETYIKKEVTAVMERLTHEQDTRSHAVTKLAQELNALTSTLTDTARQLDEKAMEGHTRLQQQLVKRTDELATNVQSRHTEITVALGRAVQDLQAAKADRAALAAILLDASKRLSVEHTDPL